MLQVQVVVRQLAPGQVQHELDVRILDAVVWRSRVVFLQAGHFLVEDGTHFLGPLFLVGPTAHFLELFALVHPELLLDGAQLVVQVIFPLLLVNVRFHLLVNLLLDLQELRLGVQHLQKGQAALVDVRDGEQRRALGEVLHLDGGGDEIHQEMEILDAAQRADGFLGREGRRFDDEGRLLLQRIRQDAKLAFVGTCRDILFHVEDAAFHVRLISDHLLQLGQRAALKDGRYGTVRHFQRLDELAHGAKTVQVPFLGVFHRHVRLRERRQPAAAGFHILHQLHGFLAAHRHRKHRSGKNDGVTQGQNGDNGR